MREIVVGTRASKLALVQTNLVVDTLRRQHPSFKIRIETIQTTGDRINDVPLARIGGDGLFVTELERALSDRRIDLAVHSLKDLPTQQPDGLKIVIIGPREDVRDLLLSRLPVTLGQDSLQFEETAQFRIGSSSLRRSAQLLALSSRIEITPIRGNVDTRIRKLLEGGYEAILVAAAGFHRLHLADQFPGQITYLPMEYCLPAPGQGALALEYRQDDVDLLPLLESLRDPIVEAAAGAERHFLRHLGAGCYLPVAAYAEVQDEQLSLAGLVTSLDGKERISVRGSVVWQERAGVELAEYLGVSLAKQALEQGADRLLNQLVREQRLEAPHA